MNIKKPIKLAESKIAKQLSAYTLIHYDLEFAGRALTQAADISSKLREIEPK